MRCYIQIKIKKKKYLLGHDEQYSCDVYMKRHQLFESQIVIYHSNLIY